MVECSYLHGVWPTLPGPSYTREFGYNEEAQLLSISHSGTLAYQYAYGADGNRRWAKDIANNQWTWYPCGVACGAGELVEQGSDLTGATWTTNAQYLRAGGSCSSMLIRRKSRTDDEYHHEDPLGVFGVITGANGATLSSNVYDAFMSDRYTTNLTGSDMLSVCFRQLDDGTYQVSTDVIHCLIPVRSIIANGKMSTSGTRFPCAKNLPVKSCLDTCLRLGGDWQQCAEMCLHMIKSGWACTAKCFIEGPQPPCGGYIYGHGRATSQADACEAAKRDAGENINRRGLKGCYKRHCACDCNKTKLYLV